MNWPEAFLLFEYRVWLEPLQPQVWMNDFWHTWWAAFWMAVHFTVLLPGRAYVGAVLWPLTTAAAVFGGHSPHIVGRLDGQPFTLDLFGVQTSAPTYATADLSYAAPFDTARRTLSGLALRFILLLMHAPLLTWLYRSLT